MSQDPTYWEVHLEMTDGNHAVLKIPADKAPADLPAIRVQLEEWIGSGERVAATDEPVLDEIMGSIEQAMRRRADPSCECKHPRSRHAYWTPADAEQPATPGLYGGMHRVEGEGPCERWCPCQGYREAP